MRHGQAAEVPFGLYRATGKREFRGHAPGTEFVARLDRPAEGHAVRRGDIELLKRVRPALEPGSFTFPEGWLSGPEINQSTEAPKGASLIRREP